MNLDDESRRFFGLLVAMTLGVLAPDSAKGAPIVKPLRR
jgi:hypothetical protein